MNIKLYHGGILLFLTISTHSMSSTISFSAVYRLTLLPIPWIITVTAAIRTLLNIMNT